jgi:hypothetical protein
VNDIPLLPLDDPRWATYRGGCRELYDAVPLINLLRSQGPSDDFWEQVWDELHHQGDVGEASYALVPYLVDCQSRQRDLDERLFHFCVVVDLQRPKNRNPPIPQELEFSYERSLQTLPVIGVEKMKKGSYRGHSEGSHGGRGTCSGPPPSRESTY